MHTILTKSLPVSSKYQITIPQNVREILDIQQFDEVVFKTDGERVYFEKMNDTKMMYPKLNAFLRHVLKQGQLVYITGIDGVGKTYLANEITSYEFNRVTYLGEGTYGTLAEVDVAQHTSLEDVCVLDEYPSLKYNGTSLDDLLAQNYPGAIIVVAQDAEELPFGIDKKICHIHITDMRTMNYIITMYDGAFNTTLSINPNTPNALTVSILVQETQQLLQQLDDSYFAHKLMRALEDTYTDFSISQPYRVMQIFRYFDELIAKEKNEQVNHELTMIKHYLLQIAEEFKQ